MKNRNANIVHYLARILVLIIICHFTNAAMPYDFMLPEDAGQSPLPGHETGVSIGQAIGVANEETADDSPSADAEGAMASADAFVILDMWFQECDGDEVPSCPFEWNQCYEACAWISCVSSANCVADEIWVEFHDGDGWARRIWYDEAFVLFLPEVFCYGTDFPRPSVCLTKRGTVDVVDDNVVISDEVSCSVADGTACDDEKYCTKSDNCQDSTCLGTPRTCTGGDECNEGYCDEGARECRTRPKPAGTRCRSSPSGDCDVQDTCNGSGTCVDYVKVNGTACSQDGNACTNDQCNGSSKSCQHPPKSSGTPCGGSLNGDCDAQDTCNGSGACVDNVKSNGTACSDHGKECTKDECNGSSKSCQHPPKSSGTPCGGSLNGDCDAQDTCNGSGTCIDNAKANGTACSNDGKECTNDVCNGSGSCTHPNNSASCNDGLYCNGADTCGGGSCSIHAGDPCPGGASCNENTDSCDTTCNCPDDGNPCTDDRCVNNWCTHPNNSASCNDGLYCNGADTCGGGSCVIHAGNPCPGAQCCTEATDSCAACPCPDDGNPCTDEVYVNNQCTHPNNSKPCNDALYCNGADTCGGGSCSIHAGTPCTPPARCDEAGDRCSSCTSDANCNDNNPCTNDRCVNGQCERTNNSVSCNDGNECTRNDRCSNGTCTGTVIPGCGADCNDNDPCTVDSSVNGRCAYTPVDCDDGNACTNDSCTAGECRYTNKTGSCNDNDSCTTNDRCTNGSCRGTPVNCDDDDPCTDDFCSGGQCRNVDNGECEESPARPGPTPAPCGVGIAAIGSILVILFGVGLVSRRIRWRWLR